MDAKAVGSNGGEVEPGRGRLAPYHLRNRDETAVAAPAARASPADPTRPPPPAPCQASPWEADRWARQPLRARSARVRLYRA